MRTVDALPPKPPVRLDPLSDWRQRARPLLVEVRVMLEKEGPHARHLASRPSERGVLVEGTSHVRAKVQVLLRGTLTPRGVCEELRLADCAGGWNERVAQRRRYAGVRTGVLPERLQPDLMRSVQLGLRRDGTGKAAKGLMAGTGARGFSRDGQCEVARRNAYNTPRNTVNSAPRSVFAVATRAIATG